MDKRNLLEILSRVSVILATVPEPHRRLSDVARLLAESFADACVIRTQTVRGMRTVGAARGRHGTTERATLRLPRAELLSSVLRLGKPRALAITGKDFWSPSAAQAKPSTARAQEFVHALIAPITLRRQASGVVCFYSAKPSKPFVDSDVIFAGEVALRIAVALEAADLHRRREDVARTLQQALLPQALPKLSGHRFQAAYAPARQESTVGGDWYDAFALPDGRVALSIGDVAGHGLRAAIVMGEVRQAFRVAALEAASPETVLQRAHQLLLLREEPPMVTAIYGVLEPSTLKFKYATAGHPPPALATSDGIVEFLPYGGTPLGIYGAQASPCWSITLPPQSLLVFYTDGLVEFDRDYVAGEAGLRAKIEAEASLNNPNPAASLRGTVIGKLRHQDDIAILTLSVADRTLESLDLSYSAKPVAARLARLAVTRFAEYHGLDKERTFDLVLAVGEAVNNVIDHAYASEPESLDIRARRVGDSLRFEIEDRGRWRPARDEGRGRGLSIIRALMSDIRIRLSRTGTMVEMSLALSPDGAVTSGAGVAEDMPT